MNGMYVTNHRRPPIDPARFALENNMPTAKQYVAIETLYMNRNNKIKNGFEFVKTAVESYIGIYDEKKIMI